MKKVIASFIVFALPFAATARAQKIEEVLAKAEQNIQKGKPEEAVKSLQKYASSNPTPEAFVALARIQERLGLFDDAAASLAKAPAGNADVLAAQASLALSSGSGKDALAKAEEAVKVQATPTALATLARAQARLGDAKAMETAEKAVQAGASSGAAHEAKGVALLAAGKGADAAASFRKALELEAGRSSARLGLAEALVADGKAAEAVVEAKKVADAEAKNGDAFAIWGKAILAQGPKDPKDPAYTKAWNEAIGQAQQGAFLNPKSALVLLIVGQIFEAQPNTEQALANYKKALALDPSYAPAAAAVRKMEARKLAMMDPAKAAELAKKTAEAEPTNGGAQLQYGTILLRAQDFAGAAAVLERATSLLPNNAEGWALLGTAYNFQNKRADALRGFEKAVQLDSKNADYVESYALLLGLAKQADKGIAVLKPIVEAPSYKSADGWINLGWLYRNAEPKKATESIQAYTKAIQIDPKNVQPYLGIGWAHIYNKASNDAIAAFQKGLAIEPKVEGEAQDGIAWAQYFNKDMTAAKASLAKAEAAGRLDTRLKDSIQRYEAAVAKNAEDAKRFLEQEKGPDNEPQDACSSALSAASGGAAAQRRAAPQLAGCGANGAQMLTWMVRNSEPDVKAAACSSLGRMGAAGKSAVPTLQWFVSQDGAPAMDSDRKAMEREIAFQSAQKACGAALNALK